MKSFDYSVGYLALAALSAAFAACAPVPVGTPMESGASATAPTVAVGDNWSYRVTDGYTRIVRGNQRHGVKEVAGDRIEMAVTRENGKEESWVYDRSWNWLKHPAHGLQSFEYAAPYPAFSFPLSPGSTWHRRLTATDPETGRRFPLTVQGTVLGWERIKVPAGEFDALKVKRVVFFDYQEFAVRGRSETVEYEWYAPAVKQSVRRESFGDYFAYIYLNRTSGGLMRAQFSEGSTAGYVKDEWVISELTAYTVR
jgi:hypothetical protein